VLRFDFRSVAPDAAEPEHRFRVCGAPDDDVDDVRAALAALAARGFSARALVGHSRGAASALYAAAREPAAARAAAAVALIAPRFDIAGMLTGKTFKKAALASLEAGAASFAWPTRHGDVAVTREDVAALRAAGTMAATLARLPAGGRLFVAHGDDDKTVPVDSARAFAELRPDATLLIVPGAGHSFDKEPHAAALIDALVAFFAPA